MAALLEGQADRLDVARVGGRDESRSAAGGDRAGPPGRRRRARRRLGPRSPRRLPGQPDRRLDRLRRGCPQAPRRPSRDGTVGSSTCSRSRCSDRSRSHGTADRSPSPAGRPRSCWCASPSTPGRSCAPTGSSRTCGPTTPSAPARNTLQSKIAKLRRALGDAAVLVSGDGGYTLAVDPDDVDALAVLRQTAAASGLLDTGDDHGAAELCASTLTMFRGDVLPGAGDGDWVSAAPGPPRSGPAAAPRDGARRPGCGRATPAT